MRRRQFLPVQWLITDERMGDALIPAAARLTRGSGILFRHHSLPKGQRARLLGRLRRIALARGLVLVDEARGRAARVHGPREIARAQLRGAEMLLLSPIYSTRSHPEWRALSRMRAAALVRMVQVPVLALGGMNARRFARVKGLGFSGWAALDAWMLEPSRE